MNMCPRCGVPNAPEQPYCSGCGYALHDPRQVRSAPQHAPPQPAPAPAPAPAFKGTMLGIAPIEAPPPTTPSHQPAHGYPAPAPPAPAYAAPAPANAHYAPPRPTGSQAPSPPTMKSTMIGMSPASNPPPPEAAVAGPGAAGDPGQRFRGTMVGLGTGSEPPPQAAPYVHPTQPGYPDHAQYQQPHQQYPQQQYAPPQQQHYAEQPPQQYAQQPQHAQQPQQYAQQPQQYAQQPQQHYVQGMQYTQPDPAAYGQPGQGHPGAAYGSTMVGVPDLDSHGGSGQPAGAIPHGTLLGVARPGIAPLNPGSIKPPAAYAPSGPAALPIPQAVRAPAHVQPPISPQGSGPQSQAASSARRVGMDRIVDADNLKLRRKGKGGVPLGATIAIVAALALLSAAVLAFFLYDSRGALSAQVALDAEGRERLELTCAKCSDESRVRLGEESAKFISQRAALLLARPLAIGDNRITLTLERTPGDGEEVELTVPVEYRVRGDTSALDEKDPRVKVQIQAVPATTIVVDGRPVTLGADGTGTADIDVSSSIRGQEGSVRRLERRIPYTITPPGSPTHSGEVSVQLGVAPLVIDAPGESIVIDSPTFVLAGRTFKGGVVAVEGRPITVDNYGKFAQMMNVSTAGETTITVRASAAGHAPRLVSIRIRRVENLASELGSARDGNAASYSQIAGDPDAKRGTRVALEGTVLEARTENFATVLLLEVKSGCSAPPCVAKITYGAKTTVTSGDPVIAVGQVVGSAGGPRENSKIPAISAEFVVKAPK